jgi:hypothetical protein
MRHDVGFLFPNGQIASLCIALIFICGCGNENTNRSVELNAPAARRLVGTWNAEFWLDRNAYHSRDTTEVPGTISLEEDTYGRISATELGDATHAGVYDLDFSRFGFEAREPDAVPTVIARVSHRIVNGAPIDSLRIVLSPGSPLFPVVMSGLIDCDRPAGQWTASAYRTGGASGHFAMTRARSK